MHKTVKCYISYILRVHKKMSEKQLETCQKPIKTHLLLKIRRKYIVVFSFHYFYYSGTWQAYCQNLILTIFILFDLKHDKIFCQNLTLRRFLKTLWYYLLCFHTEYIWVSTSYNECPSPIWYSTMTFHPHTLVCLIIVPKK